MEKKELKAGDKYLKMLVTVGDVDFSFAAFPNFEATTNNKQPNFRGKNVAVWVNTKQEKKEDVLVEQVV